jgi:hypothetical protein
MSISALAMAATILLAAATVPPAHPAPHMSYRTDTSAGFDELDRNKDGMLTPDELPPSHELSHLFAEYDHDGDNALSRSEFDLYMRGESQPGLAAGADEADEDDEDR